MTATRPMKVRERLKEYASRPTPLEYFSPGKQGAITGALNDAVGGNKERRLILGWLFEDGTPMSSKKLAPQEWNGLFQWIGAKPQEPLGGGKTIWVERDDFALEARWVYVQAVADKNRVSLDRIQEELGVDDIPSDVLIATQVLGGKIVKVVETDSPEPVSQESGQGEWFDELEKALS